MTKHQKMYFAIWDTYRTLNIVYQIDSNIMAKPKMSTASTNSIKHEYLRSRAYKCLTLSSLPSDISSNIWTLSTRNSKIAILG